MDEQKTLERIMIFTQKKYNQANEFLSLTKEMEGALARNDDVSFEMLLGMRQDVMGEINGMDEEMKNLILTLPAEKREEVSGYLKTGAEAKAGAGAKEQKILQITQATKTIFQKAKVVDDIMNKKLNAMK